MRSRRVWSLAAAGFLIVVVVGCDRAASAAQPGTPRPPQASATTVCPSPLRVVGFQDKTASGRQYRTPQLQPSDLEPLIERVTRCGGELALGIIEARSNAPLVRMYVPEPPVPPAEPEKRGTPFEVNRRRARYIDSLGRHDSAMRVHAREARREADEFRARIRTLLAIPNDFSRSDVVGAIDRAAYFASEPGQWRRAPRTIIALVSDAADNAHQPAVPLPPVEFYLINGEPSLGVFTRLGITPLRFESFAAAMRNILQTR